MKKSATERRYAIVRAIDRVEHFAMRGLKYVAYLAGIFDLADGKRETGLIFLMLGIVISELLKWRGA